MGAEKRVRGKSPVAGRRQQDTMDAKRKRRYGGDAERG
jgi:hypothetical protein